MLVGKMGQEVVASGVGGSSFLSVFVFEWLTGAQIDGQNICVSRALLWIQGDIVCFNTSCASVSIGQVGAERAIVDVP